MNTREMTKEEIPAVAKMMSKAFENDPLYKYFVPNEDKRTKFIEEFMRFRLRFGLKYGKVIVTDDLSGVIVSLPPKVNMSPLDVLFMGGVRAMLRAGMDTTTRLMTFEKFADKLIHDNLPQKSEYATIGPLAVMPKAQGKGIGKMLLTAELDKIKELSQSCFIETQTEKNKELYEHLGFTTITSGTYEGLCLTNYLMLLK